MQMVASAVYCDICNVQLHWHLLSKSTIPRTGSASLHQRLRVNDANCCPRHGTALPRDRDERGEN